MRAWVIVGMVLFASTGCGTDAGGSERAGDVTQLLSAGSGQCTAHGNGSAAPDITFAFALDVASSTTSVSFSTSAGALTDALVTSADCGAVRGGGKVQLMGTGTWAGIPGHRFVLSATDDTRHPPTTPHSFDSVRVRIVSPTHEDVFSEGGSVQSGGVTVDVLPHQNGSGSCRVEVSGIRLGSRERFSLSANTDPTFGGSVDYRRTGGGPPSTFEGVATAMLCRREGDDIADVRGIGTLNGVEGYTWAFNAELRPPQVRFSYYDLAGVRIFFAEQFPAATDLQLVLSEP